MVEDIIEFRAKKVGGRRHGGHETLNFSQFIKV